MIRVVCSLLALVALGSGIGAAAQERQAQATVEVGKQKPTCTRMPSREEAFAYVEQGGLVRLNRDEDGLPCASGLC
jgi:hypothetical protein